MTELEQELADAVVDLQRRKGEARVIVDTLPPDHDHGLIIEITPAAVGGRRATVAVHVEDENRVHFTIGLAGHVELYSKPGHDASSIVVEVLSWIEAAVEGKVEEQAYFVGSRVVKSRLTAEVADTAQRLSYRSGLGFGGTQEYIRYEPY